MKFFKYIFSLALICACCLAVSHAQTKKPTAKRGIINDTLIYVKKPVRTKTPSSTGTPSRARKTNATKSNVKAVQKNSATKPSRSKVTTRKKRPNF